MSMWKCLKFRMGYFSTVLFCVYCAHVSSQANIDGVNQFRQACLYTNFCQRNATLTMEEDSQAPCCRAYSCADDCWIRDNCCPDKILTSETSTFAKKEKVKRYKWATIRKRSNQNESPTPKTEVGKTQIDN